MRVIVGLDLAVWHGVVNHACRQQQGRGFAVEEGDGQLMASDECGSTLAPTAWPNSRPLSSTFRNDRAVILARRTSTGKVLTKPNCAKLELLAGHRDDHAPRSPKKSHVSNTPVTSESD